MSKAANFYMDNTIETIIQDIESTVIDLCNTDNPSLINSLIYQLALRRKEFTIFLGLCGRSMAKKIISERLEKLDTIFSQETRYASEYKILKAIYAAEAEKIGLEEF